MLAEAAMEKIRTWVAMVSRDCRKHEGDTQVPDDTEVTKWFTNLTPSYNKSRHHRH